MKKLLILIALAAAILSACATAHKANDEKSRHADAMATLRDSLQAIADRYPGEIGLALITGSGDTLVVNDTAKYPLMSVFKLHQAIALCNLLEKRGETLDSIVTIPRSGLNPDTWSPMLKDYTAPRIDITLRDLLRYTLTQSDNNASNYLFDHLQPVAAADSFIATIIPRQTFRLIATEEEMGRDHSLAYQNRTSPLGAALLIDRLYRDTLLSPDNLAFLRRTLRECKTGTDRIVAPLKDIQGIKIGHKTGSGYTENGILAAHNDIAFISLTDRPAYALAIFVKDFHGDETAAAQAIAALSDTIHRALTR